MRSSSISLAEIATVGTRKALPPSPLSSLEPLPSFRQPAAPSTTKPWHRRIAAAVRDDTWSQPARSRCRREEPAAARSIHAAAWASQRGCSLRGGGGRAAAVAVAGEGEETEAEEAEEADEADEAGATGPARWAGLRRRKEKRRAGALERPSRTRLLASQHTSSREAAAAGSRCPWARVKRTTMWRRPVGAGPKASGRSLDAMQVGFTPWHRISQKMVAEWS